MVDNLGGNTHEQEIRDAFKVFDRDGDGTISAKELKFICANLGEKLNEDEIAHMMSIVDKNGNGFIDYNEFSSMIIHSIAKFFK